MEPNVNVEFEHVKDRVIALSKEGKYGEAASCLNSILFSSDEELKRKIKDAIQEQKNEEIAMEQCCQCCSECKCDGLASVYCLGVMLTVFCCGSDVASSCCGCDWMIDTSSSCVRDQCC